MYSPVPANDDDRPNEDDQWRGVRPVTGFRNLAVMSLITFLICLLNVGVQAYITASMKESGTYTWDRKDASSVWAASTGAVLTIYLFIVAHKARHGLRSAKTHLVFGIVGGAIATGLLLAGLIISGVTASNIATVKSDDTRTCVYYNNSFPFAPPTPTLPPACSDCDVSYYYPGQGVAPSTCCCCYSQQYYSSRQTLSFFGVKSCDAVFDVLYLTSTLSAVLYGVTLLVAFIASITGCVVGFFQCRSCSDICGPFSQEQRPSVVTAGAWSSSTSWGSGYNHVVAAAPVTGQAIVATPAYAAQGIAPPPQPYYGGAPQPAHAQNTPNFTGTTVTPDLAGATPTAPPFYNDALASNRA